MTLLLSLRNCDSLPDGKPARLELDRRGAVIGRSPTVDWVLPDPSRFISSRHCEIRYDAGIYLVQDLSTNGTLLNGVPVTGSQRLAEGDVLTIGAYEAVVALREGFSASSGGAAAGGGWGGWDSHGSATPVGVDPSDWGKAPPQSAISGFGPLSGNVSGSMPLPAPESQPGVGWGAPPPAAPSGWDAEVTPASGSGSIWGSMAPAASPPPTSAPASSWSSAPGQPAANAAQDIWGRLEKSNDVDWERAGFGVASPPPTDSRLGLSDQGGWGTGGASWPATPEQTPPQSPSQPSTAITRQPAVQPPPLPAPVTASPAGVSAQLAAVLGLAPDSLRQPDAETIAVTGGLLRALVAGLVVMLQARARAKAQMGAQTTTLEFEGNNPLKFARSAEKALAQLLNPPERGFMTAERAVQDAFVDLQSHQMATLRAMQGALRATLDRFSPKAISDRYQARGIIAQILPGAHDAALWRAYVEEFSGVAQGSEEAFMDVFSKEFRKAYENEAARAKR